MSIISKRIERLIFDQVLSRLEDQKNKPKTKDMYIDVFNSGVHLDLERVRVAALDVAIKIVGIIRDDMTKQKAR